MYDSHDSSLMTFVMPANFHIAYFLWRMRANFPHSSQNYFRKSQDKFYGGLGSYPFIAAVYHCLEPSVERRSLINLAYREMGY